MNKLFRDMVTKSNDLIRAVEGIVEDPNAEELRLIRAQIDTKLAVSARRLLEAFISQIDLAHPENKEVEIPKIELEQVIGRGLLSSEYKALCRSLTRIGYEIDTPKRFTVAILIEKAQYEYNDKGEGILKAKFSDSGVEFIAVQRKYTRYYLVDYLCLESNYAQRLFPLLKSWESQKEGFFMGLNEFYKYLDLAELYRKNAAELKRRILEPARKEMAKKINFDWQYAIDKKQKQIFFAWGKQDDNPKKALKKREKTPLEAAKLCVKRFKKSGAMCPNYANPGSVKMNTEFDEKRCFACRKRELLKGITNTPKGLFD